MHLLNRVRLTCACTHDGDLRRGSEEDPFGQFAQRLPQALAQIGWGERDDQRPQPLDRRLQGDDQAFQLDLIDALLGDAGILQAHHHGDHELHGAVVDGLGEQCPLPLLHLGQLFEQFPLVGCQFLQTVGDGAVFGALVFQQLAYPAFGDDVADPVGENLDQIVVTDLVGPVTRGPVDPQVSQDDAVVAHRRGDEMLHELSHRVTQSTLKVFPPVAVS